MSAPHIIDAKPLVAIKGFAIPQVRFKNSGGAVVECTVSPELPVGLKLSVEHKTCVISGTPMILSSRAIYTVTAINHDGKNTAIIEITVGEAHIKTQREAIIHVHDARHDLDTPRSQIENAMSDEAMMGSQIKPHEKFMNQPTGDDKRLAQQTANNPEAENRAQNTPELTPSPSAQLQAQAVARATPPSPTPMPGK